MNDPQWLWPWAGQSDVSRSAERAERIDAPWPAVAQGAWPIWGLQIRSRNDADCEPSKKNMVKD